MYLTLHQRDCLTNELVAWSHATLLQLSNNIASNNNDFSAFETHFLGSITQGFKKERETKSKFFEHRLGSSDRGGCGGHV
jgi:hypothetical protein